MSTTAPLHPLPDVLVAGHRDWYATGFMQDRDRFAALAESQDPLAMVVACCDSRVDPAEFFGVEAGTLFTLRNIANLVPPAEANIHSIKAAVEFAVGVLLVPHIIVMGHSNCGGVHHGYHIHNGTPEVTPDMSVYKWLKMMQPAYDRLNKDGGDAAHNIADLEKISVLVSLENLAAYPVVADAMQKGALQLHGAWRDIASGHLHFYNPSSGEFESIT